MRTEKKLEIAKVENGWTVSYPDGYNSYARIEIFTTFDEAVARLAERLDQKAFAATVQQSQAFSSSLMKFVELAVKPKFEAIESKLNPGVETVVTPDDIDNITNF